MERPRRFRAPFSHNFFRVCATMALISSSVRRRPCARNRTRKSSGLIQKDTTKRRTRGYRQVANVKRRNFALAVILPPNQRSIIQCTSTAGPGVTISYVSMTSLTSTVTVTGEDGTVTRQANTRSANLPTSTVVQLSIATIYAPPVNGYNLVQRQAGVGATDLGATSSTATTPATTLPGTNDVSTQSSGPAQPSALTPGAIAGAVVGAVLGLGLLVLGAFFVRQRYQRHSAVDRPDLATWRGGARDTDGPPHGLIMSEMPVEERAQELPHGLYAHELPGQE